MDGCVPPVVSSGPTRDSFRRHDFNPEADSGGGGSWWWQQRRRERAAGLCEVWGIAPDHGQLRAVASASDPTYRTFSRVGP